MKIFAAWRQQEERWAEQLAAAIAASGVAVRSICVDEGVTPPQEDGAQEDGAQEDGAQEDGAGVATANAALRSCSVVIPILGTSAVASNEMEQFCRQAFDLVR